MNDDFRYEFRDSTKEDRSAKAQFWTLVIGYPLAVASGMLLAYFVNR